MRVLLGIAVAAALSVGMLSTAAMAARVGGTPAPGGGASPDICIAACITVPRTPAPPPNYHLCSDKLAELRPVTVGQVRRIHAGDVVHLVPLCDVVNHTLTQQQERYLSRGNVQGLIPEIGRNRVLITELAGHGYKANDVIGIAIAPRAAMLYVSRHQ